MMKLAAANVMSVKNDNRALILNEIRKSPCSRAQLSQATALTRSAVTMIVQELMADGLIQETRTLRSERGRHQVLLDIVYERRLALGLALHRRQSSVVLTDLRGRSLAKRTASSQDFADRIELLTWAKSQMQELIDGFAISRDMLIGIGISSPGPLDLEAGRILQPVDFDLLHNCEIVELVKGFSFKFSASGSGGPASPITSSPSHPASPVSSSPSNSAGPIASDPLPVNLDNNSVLLAVREFYQADSRLHAFKNTLFVTIAHGIGSCLLANGQIYRGMGGYAGELGHTSINATGRPCPCGNIGCLERYASLEALEEYFAFSDFQMLVDLAYNGQGKPLAILEQLADWLAAALVNAVNLFDLDAIVLYGELNYRPQLLISMIEGKINERSLISKVHPIAVLASVFGQESAAEAATAGIIDDLFKQRL